MTGTSAPDEPAAETPEAQTAGPQPSGLEVELAACLAKLDEAQTQAASARDAQLRAVADLDNVRKRAEREVANATRYGSEKLLGELLGVADSLDLGLAAAAKPEALVGEPIWSSTTPSSSRDSNRRIMVRTKFGRRGP